MAFWCAGTACTATVREIAGVKSKGNMENVDQVVAEILHAEDGFLSEIGRLTLLFSRIEDLLIHHAVELAQIGSNKELQEVAVSTGIAQLRMLEKRDFLKRVVAEIGRFYDVDHSRVCKVLDELGNLNRLRRTVVHGWIRWSVADQMPILVDSHGQSVPAWPTDLAGLNLKVLNWISRYCTEQRILGRDVLRAYNALADKLLRKPRVPPELQVLIRKLKTDFADDL